ncbi:hypothetical protein ASE85_03365 [Sphingobium sp. Leaf26]|uniref:TIGR02594 family protein n=1 Tax=Sphingobium sp. Leaf26 TaxID=1735693 RepID=UPI0006F340BE|nr:TIGR02594 family protein [Sphingobium sp. Leaf26]KQN09983.1 hypothetical protein ASE85_03365 [Sphingobium sp. Leaf26]
MTNEIIWVDVARKLIGTREIKGPKHNQTIMGWIKRLGSKVLGIAVTDDETPWCGTFMAAVMTECGFAPPKVAVRASSWDAFGVAVSKPYLGAVVRFQRPGGGHVGIIIGQSKDGKLLRVLGGNQSDSVNETWIERSRAVAYRWPSGVGKPELLAPILTHSGLISKDEA